MKLLKLRITKKDILRNHNQWEEEILKKEMTVAVTFTSKS